MEKFQYNKISLIQINRDLALRRSALPVLQNKESALRVETQRIRRRIAQLEHARQEKITALQPLLRLWAEFPRIVRVQELRTVPRRVAGVPVRQISEVVFSIEPVCWFSAPAWFARGIEIVQELLRLGAELDNEREVLAGVEYARRKTTQKVNLYERVQIPFFEESIRKIKRFLEDEDNLSKAAQKVLKQRLAAV